MTDTIYKIFGISLRTERLKSGLTLEKLGEMSGITGAFVCHIEAGRKKPSLYTAHKLADALGVTVSFLLKEEASLSKNSDDLAYTQAFGRILKGKRVAQKQKLLNVVKDAADLLDYNAK